MSRKLWVGLAALLIAVTVARAEKLWLDEMDKGLEQAKADSKYMLVDFSGSDWCGWCQKLDAEVFSKKEFKEYAASNLVCVIIDFPKRKPQGKKERERNMALKDKYGVSGFPTVLVMSPQGEEVGRTGYQPGGPERFIQDVQAFIDQHKKATEQKAGAEQK